VELVYDEVRGEDSSRRASSNLNKVTEAIMNGNNVQKMKVSSLPKGNVCVLCVCVCVCVCVLNVLLVLIFFFINSGGSFPHLLLLNQK
jgi:hypothetical protein